MIVPCAVHPWIRRRQDLQRSSTKHGTLLQVPPTDADGRCGRRRSGEMRRDTGRRRSRMTSLRVDTGRGPHQAPAPPDLLRAGPPCAPPLPHPTPARAVFLRGGRPLSSSAAPRAAEQPRAGLHGRRGGGAQAPCRRPARRAAGEPPPLGPLAVAARLTAAVGGRGWGCRPAAATPTRKLLRSAGRFGS